MRGYRRFGVSLLSSIAGISMLGITPDTIHSLSEGTSPLELTCSSNEGYEHCRSAYSLSSEKEGFVVHRRYGTGHQEIIYGYEHPVRRGEDICFLLGYTNKEDSINPLDKRRPDFAFAHHGIPCHAHSDVVEENYRIKPLSYHSTHAEDIEQLLVREGVFSHVGSPRNFFK